MDSVSSDVIKSAGKMVLEVELISVTPRSTDMVDFLKTKCPCVTNWAANQTVTFDQNKGPYVLAATKGGAMAKIALWLLARRHVTPHPC